MESRGASRTSVTHVASARMGKGFSRSYGREPGTEAGRCGTSDTSAERVFKEMEETRHFICGTQRLQDTHQTPKCLADLLKESNSCHGHTYTSIFMATLLAVGNGGHGARDLVTALAANSTQAKR